MGLPDLRRRTELAATILAHRDLIAREVTEEFIRRHPEWLEKWLADRIRKFGCEDAGFHLDFLAGAVEQGSPEAFHHYVSWAGRVLEARGISKESLQENIEQIELRLGEHLGPRYREFLAPFFCEAQTDGEVDEDPSEPPFREEASIYTQSLLRGARRSALKVLEEALSSGATLEDIYLRIIEEGLYEIGRLWERSHITVAEEHMATAVAQYTVSRLYERLEPPDEVRGRVVITGVQGELHQIGANMVADVLEIKGWDVRFLGTNLPHEGVLKVVRDFEPDWVGVSATMLFSLRRVRDLVDSIRELKEVKAPRIVLGGAAFRHKPDLVRELGENISICRLNELETVFGAQDRER